MVTSAVAAFFYARVVVLMFFQEPAEDSAAVVLPSFPTSLALGNPVKLAILLKQRLPFL